MTGRERRDDRTSMKTVKEVEPLRVLVRKARAEGRSIGFVPTMGALHEGHLSLVRRARKTCGYVIVSIFVNPLQFAPGEDLSRYPRREREDAALLEGEGVDLLFLPDAGELYPPDFSTSVEVARVSEGGEGAARPGHFRGVATVVAKLFLQVQPDFAFFGRKDLQQVAVIRQMTRDLDLPISIEVGDTVREADGLALSSRNAYLSADERQLAAGFPAALFEARDRVTAGERSASQLEKDTRRDLQAAGLMVDYVEVVDPDTMSRPPEIEPGSALCAAIRVGKTRLIDNVLLLEE
jgi:pantoate--beta-alanine ligase